MNNYTAYCTLENLKGTIKSSIYKQNVFFIFFQFSANS